MKLHSLPTQTAPLLSFSTPQEKISSAVYQSSLSILAAQSHSELYEKVFSELVSLIHARSISIYQAQNGELKKIYTSLSELKSIQPRKNGFTYKAYQDSVPYILDNKKIYDFHPKVKTLRIPTTLFIPLIFENEPVGVISVDFSKTTRFSEEALQTFKLLGSIITFKIKNLDLYNELKQLTESQQLFISLASHELKNPLTAVSAYAQIVQHQLQKNQTIDPALIEKLLYEIQRISNLVNELLNLKNSSLGEVNLHFQKKVHLCHKIIEHAVTNFKLSYPKRVVRFYNSLDKDDLIFGDYQKLLQLFINILNNANKFSPKKSQISIHLSIENEMVVIQFKDKGKGISTKHLPHIFDPYFRGATPDKKDGMGLGLFLCKKIVDEHSGTITAFSRLRKGTTIQIELPLYHETD